MIQRPPAMTKAPAPRGIDLTPIAFKVRAPIFFRGERIEAGTIIEAEVTEAVDLHGNVRVELVTSGDWKRLRDLAHTSADALFREAHKQSSWVRQFNRA